MVHDDDRGTSTVGVDSLPDRRHYPRIPYDRGPLLGVNTPVSSCSRARALWWLLGWASSLRNVLLAAHRTRGGVVRDLVLGEHPPAACESWSYLLTASAAAVLMFI